MCCEDPVTGFYRDGKCNTNKQEVGSHAVCIKVTQEFLEYSRSKGNDLSTPVPEYGFEGVKEGHSWCLCAMRWLEAEQATMAPSIHLKRTHIKALELVPMALLKPYALDLN